MHLSSRLGGLSDTKMITKEDIFNGRSETVCILKWKADFSLFFKEVLKKDLKPHHKEWCDLIQYEQRLAISAPTSYGKSEIFGIAFPIWLSYFFPKSESLLVSSKVQGQSQTLIEKIKLTILDNEFLKESLIPERSDKEFEFSSTRMVFSNGSKVYLKAYSPGVRGDHVDYLFGDEVAIYKDKADDYIIWFRDFLSRVEGKLGKVAAVSTPVEPGDLITLLLTKKGWVSRTYAALVDKEGKPAIPPYSKDTAFPIWPERHSFEELMRIRDEQGEEVFERNYQCDPRAAVSKAIFKIKDVTSGYDVTKDFTHKSLGGLVFIGADFAMSEHKDADKDAFVVIEKIGDLIWVKHMELHNGLPVDDKIDRLRELSKLHRPYQILCDSSNVGKDISQKLLSFGIPAIEVPFGPKNRREMLSTLKIVVSSKRLKLPYNKESPETIRLAEELVYQLSGFKEEKSQKTRLPLIVSTSNHDDLVAALALAVSGAEEQDTSIGGFASGNF